MEVAAPPQNSNHDCKQIISLGVWGGGNTDQPAMAWPLICMLFFFLQQRQPSPIPAFLPPSAAEIVAICLQRLKKQDRNQQNPTSGSPRFVFYIFLKAKSAAQFNISSLLVLNTWCMEALTSPTYQGMRILFPPAYAKALHLQNTGGSEPHPLPCPSHFVAGHRDLEFYRPPLWTAIRG